MCVNSSVRITSMESSTREQGVCRRARRLTVRAVLPCPMLQVIQGGKVPAAAAAGDLPGPLNTDNVDSGNDADKYVVPSSQLSRTHLIRRVWRKWDTSDGTHLTLALCYACRIRAAQPRVVCRPCRVSQRACAALHCLLQDATGGRHVCG